MKTNKNKELISLEFKDSNGKKCIIQCAPSDPSVLIIGCNEEDPVKIFVKGSDYSLNYSDELGIKFDVAEDIHKCLEAHRYLDLCQLLGFIPIKDLIELIGDVE